MCLHVTVIELVSLARQTNIECSFILRPPLRANTAEITGGFFSIAAKKNVVKGGLARVGSAHIREGENSEDVLS